MASRREESKGPFPKRNLPGDAGNWGRKAEDRILQLESDLKSIRERVDSLSPTVQTGLSDASRRLLDNEPLPQPVVAYEFGEFGIAATDWAPLASEHPSLSIDYGGRSCWVRFDLNFYLRFDGDNGSAEMGMQLVSSGGLNVHGPNHARTVPYFRGYSSTGSGTTHGSTSWIEWVGLPYEATIMAKRTGTPTAYVTRYTFSATPLNWRRV